MGAIIDNEKCIGCGRCVEDCLFDSLKLADGKARLDGRCISCGHCVALCQEGAAALPEYDMGDIEEFSEGSFRLEPLTLLRAIKYRRSIRQFTGQKIERNKLEAIIQAGRYTATGLNAQGCKFIVVQDDLPALKEMIWHDVERDLAAYKDLGPEFFSAMRGFIDLRKTKGIDFLFRNAPAALFIAAEKPIDAGLAAQNMELMAVAQDLGALFNGFLARLASKNEKALGWLKTEGKPLATSMLFGYPNVRYQRTAPRKPANVDWR